MFKIISGSLVFCITLFYPQINLLGQPEKNPVNSQDAALLQAKIDSLKKSYDEKISNIKNADLERDIAIAQGHIETANRIIDWSAMIFTALAILLVIAGAIGLREFARIQKIERSMNTSLREMKRELENIRGYREQIVSEMRAFMEVTYYYNEGFNAYHEGNYLRARECLYKALDHQGDNLDVKYWLGRSYSLDDMKEEADRVFTELISINPNYPKGYLGLALNCTENEVEKAIDFCSKAVEIDPNYSAAYDTLGIFYRKINNLDMAFKSHLKARNIRKQSMTSFFIGLLYYVKGDLVNAEKYFEETKYLCLQQLEKAQMVHWSYFEMGIIEGLNKNMKIAKNYLKKSLENNRAKNIVNLKIEDLEFIINHSDKNQQNVASMIAYLKNHFE